MTRRELLVAIPAGIALAVGLWVALILFTTATA